MIQPLSAAVVQPTTAETWLNKLKLLAQTSIVRHQRYRQTDRQTDRQTTCDRNTALCTKVHRAVKTWFFCSV